MDLVCSGDIGVSDTRKSLVRNYSPMPEYRMDWDQGRLEIVFHLHPAFRNGVSCTDLIPMEAFIVSMLGACGCMTTGEISEELGYPKVTVPVRKAIRTLMDEGQIEYLYPDNPRDPRQRICLKKDTSKGKSRIVHR